MKAFKTLFRNSFTVLLVLLQISTMPFIAYAEDTAPASDPVSTPTTTTSVDPAPAATTPTPQPEPNPYVLNPDTGNYENDKYIWDPNTYQTTPKTPQNYSYNPTTNTWETTEWATNPNNGEYAPNAPAPTSSETQSEESLPQSLTQNNTPLNPLLNNSILGPDSENFINLNSDNSAFFNGFYNATISNNIYSTAKSGNASVTQNTIGGNALSGNASAVANLINILQTAFSPGGSGNLSTFVANIDGNVVGDIMIDPGQIPANDLKVVNGNSNNDIAINVQNNGQINNNINLAATSGDADVSNNTEAGNATSGDATVIANVINMINSSIAAGDSFFGIVNINGNFDGDILMPPNALDYLLASSIPRTTVNLADITNNTTVDANLTNSQAINNNVNAEATSGQAMVSNNTTGGNATTGNASTDVTILNMTGSNIIGNDALLVFVNVLGQWVGMIVNAPNGSTAAAYGGGITSYTGNTDNNLAMNVTNNSQINNNINAAARSGDAAVDHNTIGGDATSGDATAKVNLNNIINSNIALTNWFGILFINVFGTWNGSFGVDTAAGNIPQPPTQNQSGSNPAPVFTFIPNTQSVHASNSRNHFGVLGVQNSSGGSLVIDNNDPPVVLASSSSSGPNGFGAGSGSTTVAKSPSTINRALLIGSILLLLITIGGERALALLKNRRSAQIVS